MKIQDAVDDSSASSSLPPPSKGRARLATLAAALVVALLVAASAIVYTQLGQHRKGQSSTPPPPAHTWVQVSHGYTFASLMAAESDPSILYACVIPVQSTTSNNNSASSYTILRSTDFGTHWRDVGSKANLGNSCQLAINPTNSSELYAIGLSVEGQSATSVLLHSTDGGQTWSTIQPRLAVPGAKIVPTWNVQQLTMVGNTLFGMQWLLQTNPPIHSGVPRAFARLTRLVTSTDGGHTWTVINQDFTSARQLVVSYVVDPSNTNTIYELVGSPWLPIEPTIAEPDIATIYSSNDALYKTRDHGATWQLLLQNLSFGTQLHLASGNPQILYVGGFRIPLPLSRGENVTGDASVLGSFRLQVSRDGGSSWHDVPTLPHVSPQAYISSWQVSPAGDIYISPTSNSSSDGQSTPVAMPPGAPQSNIPAITGRVFTLYQSALTTSSPSYTPGPLVSIQRYDPTSNAWSAVTMPPTYGTLLATTPGSTNETVLWLMSSGSAGQLSLYRYLV
jgi:hypothetical protein